MRELKYPAIYKHFKKNFYATMDISNAVDPDDINKLTQLTNVKFESYSIEHTELDSRITIYKFYNQYYRRWYHLKDDDVNDLVLYKSLYDNTGIYARPIDMFLSPVDKSKYPNTNQEYRFELINEF